jgi:integrase
MKRKEWKSVASGNLIENLIERYLFPALEHEPIADITGPMVLAALRKIPSECMQAKARGVASQIFRFAVAEEKCHNDPAATVKGALGKHQGESFPTIDPARLPHLLNALDHYGEQSPGNVSRERQRISQIATIMSALTFVRPTELRLAEWSEIDFDAALWTIPGDRMKKVAKRSAGHGDHLVPLSRQALALLTELREITKRIARSSPYVFPAHRAKKTQPMYKHTVYGVLQSIGYGGEMSAHGFRHLASTLMNEAHDADGNRRFDKDVIERQLGHISGGVRGVYNKAEYLPQRVKLMQAYADMLDAARARGDGGNVVPIGKRKAA